MSDLDTLAKAGIAAINDGDFGLAIEKFQAALMLEPDRPDMNSALGMAYLHRGQIYDALPLLVKAHDLAAPIADPDADPMKQHFASSLATAYEISDQTQKAIDLLKNTIKKWPTLIEPRVQLGQLQLSSCLLSAGVDTYQQLAVLPNLEPQRKEAALAIVGSIEEFLRLNEDGMIFLRAHADEYRAVFDELVGPKERDGWLAEAARMAPPVGESGPRPIIPEGAKPYAMQRVDLVDPSTGEITQVYSHEDPLAVAVGGLEPLSQIPVMFQAQKSPFNVWVCSISPWHWLKITVEFATTQATQQDLCESLDKLMGEWYLEGFNGTYGERESGRFHYISDSEAIDSKAFSYTVDLGRSRFDAINGLLKRLDILHHQQPINCILFGSSKLPAL